MYQRGNYFIYENYHFKFTTTELFISLICFNDILNAINVSRIDQISPNLIDLQLPISPTAAHAKMPIIVVQLQNIFDIDIMYN